MKKEISIIERPERFTEQYLAAYGNMSWYDFVTAMPFVGIRRHRLEIER